MKIPRLQCLERPAIPMGRLALEISVKLECQARMSGGDQVVIDRLR